MKNKQAIERLLEEVASRKHAYSREVCELLQRRAKRWNPAERRELWAQSQQRKEICNEMRWMEKELEKILMEWL